MSRSYQKDEVVLVRRSWLGDRPFDATVLEVDAARGIVRVGAPFIDGGMWVDADNVELREKASWGAGGAGGGRSPPPPPEVAPAPPAPPAPQGDEGVTAAPLSGLSIWVVALRGAPLPMGRFDGSGAEGRAKAYAASVRDEIRAGTFGLRAPKGTCRHGKPCDRERVHGFLRDIADHVLAAVCLCDEHHEEARPGSRKPAAPPPAPVGRRRKGAS